MVDNSPTQQDPVPPPTPHEVEMEKEEQEKGVKGWDKNREREKG